MLIVGKFHCSLVVVASFQIAFGFFVDAINSFQAKKSLVEESSNEADEAVEQALAKALESDSDDPTSDTENQHADDANITSTVLDAGDYVLVVVHGKNPQNILLRMSLVFWLMKMPLNLQIFNKTGQ